MKEVELLRSLNDGNLSHAQQLLDDGADCNYVLQEEGVAGVAPMHMAVGLSLDTLRLLLQYGGDPNVRSVEGVTPLHIAATWGELDSVKLLLFNGGDPNIQDQEGLRAVEVARKYNHEQVACYLQYYALLLVPDDAMQIKYTRESLEAHRDNTSEDTSTEVLNQSFLEDSSQDQSEDTCTQRSSVSTSTMHRQLSARCVRGGEHVYVDALSPRQPAIETNHMHECCRRADCRNCGQNFQMNGDERKFNSHQRNGRGQCVECERRKSEGRCQGHTEVTFTDSDPDCCEVCSEDEVRHRLGEFHWSCVRGHRHVGGYQQVRGQHQVRGQQYVRGHQHNINTNNNRHSQDDALEFCSGCYSGSSLHHHGSSLRCDTSMRHLCGDYEYRRKRSHRCECEGHSVHNGNGFVETTAVLKSVPVKTPNNQKSLTIRHWSKLQKPETSAEKVGRWQSTILEENGHVQEVEDVGHLRSSGCQPLRTSPQVCQTEAKSPRFFPQLSGHEYIDEPDESPKTVSKLYSNNLSREAFEYIPVNSDHCNGHIPEARTGARKLRGDASSRRSSVYTRNVQRELDQYLQDGRSVLFDVTSPGHPYVQFKSGSSRATPPRGVSVNVQPLHASPSTQEMVNGAMGKSDDKRPSFDGNASESSCNTFVTCEDDTEFTHVTPVDTITSAASSVYREITLNGHDEKPKDDPINGERQDGFHTARNNGRSSDAHLRSTSPRKHSLPSHPVQDAKLDISSKSRSSNSGTHCSRKGINKVQSDIRSFSPSKHQWQPPANIDVDMNTSDLVTSDDSFFERTETSTAKPTQSSERNSKSIKSQVKKTVQKWLAPSVLDNLDEMDLMTSDESFQQRVSCNEKNNGYKISNLVDQLGKVSVATSKISPLYQKKGGQHRISLDSGCSSSSVKEYLYRDEEKDITLLERLVPSACDESSTRSSLSSCCSHNLTVNSEDTEIYNWQDYQTDTDEGGDVGNTQRRKKTTSTTTTRATRTSSTTSSDIGIRKAAVPGIGKAPVPGRLSQLSNKEIREKLQSLGDDPGPVVASTRQAYLVRLASFEADPSMVNQMKLSTHGPEYSPELHAGLQGNLDLADIDDMESKMIASFENSQGRCWREGTQKSSFNYLLLDPRVTRNLPLRAKTLGQAETFKAFIHAIFYVGKGKRARPYCHLYEAIKHMQKPKSKVSTKVQHIIDIWSEGLGVVSLHCFQSVIPVEAYTREACMVEAIGLSKLTNVKRGDYYGAASTWPLKSKRTLGVHLLHKALQIFLGEGERQISPVDMKTGSDKT